MKKITRLILIKTVLTLGLAKADVTPDQTRLIFNEKDESVSMSLPNSNPSKPYLVQAWIENPDGSLVTNVPLEVKPATQRIDGHSKGAIHITKKAEIEKLPANHESLFYLNIREIPPQTDNQNTMALAIQSRIKIFYRPQKILPERNKVNLLSQLLIYKKGGFINIKNPTSYYITIISLTQQNKKPLTPVSDMMIAPKSTRDIKINLSAIRQFKIIFINDYGALQSMLYQCDVSLCKALTDVKDA